VDRFLLKTMPDATAVRRKMLFVKLGTRKREIRLDENGALAANALRSRRGDRSTFDQCGLSLSSKNLWKMSKRAHGKRQHYEAAKFSGPDDKQ